MRCPAFHSGDGSSGNDHRTHRSEWDVIRDYTKPYDQLLDRDHHSCRERSATVDLLPESSSAKWSRIDLLRGLTLIACWPASLLAYRIARRPLRGLQTTALLAALPEQSDVGLMA
jgi:hypothetical protein